MRVVLDSNVLLAALATHGLCESIVSVSLRKHQICISDHLLKEVERNLTGKFKMPSRQAAERVRFLRRHSYVVEPAAVEVGACGDPGDLPVLGTALAANADCLVSGDQDLLVPKNFKGIPTLSPRAFYERLK